jgi:glycosyltransferase involved in cell wall biosynthesis
MENNLFIITNESIYRDQNGNYLCDNIDIKSIPEGLNNFSKVTIVGRKSSKQRSKKISLKKINASKNIITYLKVIYKSFEEKNTDYLIISLSPFTFLASILLKLFAKKHFLYFRSDGYEEYRAILGFIGPFIYHVMFKLGIKNANLISCRKHLLRESKGNIVSPSQLNEKWFQNIKKINPNNIKLLYVGRLRVEKGIFSLVSLLKRSQINLTIITSEKGNKLEDEYDNIKHISFDNYNDAIIKVYDEHSIFVLPSYTEAHPQVVDEALARTRPVIVFKDIEHVKRDREGVFVCERNLKSLQDTIKHINSNYELIISKIKKNKLPTKFFFINELKKIILN